MSSLYFGANATPTNLMTGELGSQTISLNNVIKTKYNWKGSADTFLNDKGSSGNDLTGVNTTLDDRVKYEGKYK